MIPRLLLAAVLALAPAMLLASPIKSDEEVLFFRTGASVLPGAETQAFPVRGWVFEPETNSFVRRMLLRGLVEILGLPKGSDANELFRRRAQMFLVDSESRKDVVVRIRGEDFQLPRTRGNGLMGDVFQGPPAEVPADPSFLRYAAVLPEGDGRSFRGEIQLSRPEGLAVVSDIDDTIKVTVVKDTKEMLRNSFLRPFQVIEGAAEAYQAWAAEGAVFHYLSGSPVQLYPSLVEFLDTEGFPLGGVHLRALRGKSPEEIGGQDSEEHKLHTLNELLALHPQRQFVLVGDSGEADAEIYARIARENPGRVVRILIREAPLAENDPERFEAIFEGLPADLWEVFQGEVPGL